MREILNMNFDWKFHDGDILTNRSFNCTHENVCSNPQWMKSGNNGISKWGYDDSDWKSVDLPHDFVCERSEFSDKESPSQGSLRKGIVWYRKAFELDESDRKKSISIEFDGIFRNYEVWLNGHFLGRELSGYKSVSFCIDDVCNYGGVNVIAVRVDATDYEGWWYEGGGIYRNVRLVKVNPLHVKQWGTFVKSTVNEDKSADLDIETTLHNENSSEISFELLNQVIDANGSVKAETASNNKVQAYEDITVFQNIHMNKVNLWDVDDPYLYELNTIVKVDGQVVDVFKTKFGVRTIEFTSDKGFYLNGKNIKLKGVCCHEDHAGVGVALPDSLHEYRIKKIKRNGMQCIQNFS